MTAPHMLIVGSGSVGKRHARNLASLGCRISCVDPRAERREELAAETPVVGSHPTIEAALAAGGLDGVVIGSPTAFHPAQTIAALDAGLPVLLEKPVAKTAAEARTIYDAQKRTGVPVLLGYTWRWWPPLLQVRSRLNEGTIGKLRHVQFHMSAHLADWHPWEPYQEFFMASAAQGGGALLDESHWIDLMTWFFGTPAELSGRVEKISDLDIETDDNVDALAMYPDGLRVSLHLDLYGRPHEKYIRFIGEGGSLFWSADPNRITIGKQSGQVWEEETFTCERNDMFVAVAREFLDVVAGRSKPSCTLADGIKVMDLIEAIRTSSAEGCTVQTGKADA
ncbi:Gfo/Idh/MocA family protein [Pseudorhodoplanes sinuspersici]|nr:Gfo/Idh/MocA family oxidoreductase [Pseudorhodoplanes sinuspersici]RKE72314.1 putative dehydrogenase [Pseudorhodoplanes sinuspersici]